MVILIGAEWRPRTYLRAQLVAQGHETFAVESWDEAELLLRARAVRPRVTVFDVVGEGNPEAALRTLARLLPPDAVIVLTSAVALPVEEVRALGFGRVLARPFAVADAVRAVEACLDARCRAGDQQSGADEADR